jgi:hypothetical protein
MGAPLSIGGPENPCGDDTTILGLQDFDRNAGQLDTDTCFRNVLKMFKNEPI